MENDPIRSLKMASRALLIAALPLVAAPMVAEQPHPDAGNGVILHFPGADAGVDDRGAEKWGMTPIDSNPDGAGEKWRMTPIGGAEGGEVLLPSRVLLGEEAGSGFGAAVATAGDINGDGFSDLIVGAPTSDDGANVAAGQVRIYHGSPAGVVEVLRLTGSRADARFGDAVSSAGDVNGDGYDDIIVGEAGIPKTVHVYLGSPGGLVLQNSWTFSDTGPGSNLGTVVARAGDVNGDGYSDVILGGRPSANVGVVRVFCGSADGLQNTAWVAADTPESSNFGQSVATAGDVNGDGYSDILVGARTANASGLAAYVYLGGPGSIANPCGLPVPAVPHWTFNPQGDTGLGEAVATAGDIDGDGYADIVIGSASVTRNRALVFYGSARGLQDCPDPVDCDMTTRCRQTACCTQELTGGDNFGASVASAGDWNGDGYADVIVGAPIALNHTGSAHLLLGTCRGLRTPAQAVAQIGATVQEAGFGRVVRSAGDVNGDGFGDLIVGAPAKEFAEGAAYVFHGRALPSPARTPDWILDEQTFFGDRIAAAGDINGDGLGDMIGVELDRSRVALYAGFPNGSAPRPPRFVDGPRFEVASAAGDFDGDGYGDVVAGAPSATGAGGAGSGLVTILRGSRMGLAEGWTVLGTHAQSQFGAAVAAAGDVDGDGFADVIVGAPGRSGGPTGVAAGAAILYRGSADGPIADDWSPQGVEAGARFGAAVSSAGDVNGDGFADVVVGAPCTLTSPACPSQKGRSYLYLGSATGLSDTPVWVAEGTPPFGGVVVSGDVNGDGYSDITIGQARGAQALASARTFTYLGSAAGLSRLAAAIIDEGEESDLSLAGAGDVNGDGYDDLLVGTRSVLSNLGRARLYHGSAKGLNAVPAWEVGDPDLSSYFGETVAVADMNGDGFADLMVNSGFGRALGYYGNLGGVSRAPQQLRVDQRAPVGHLGVSDRGDAVRLQARAQRVAGDGSVGLQWELKPLATPFDGEALSKGLVQTRWRASGRVSPDFVLNERAAGLDDHTYYRWRARVVSNLPLVPRSPWFSPEGGSATQARFRTAGDLPAPVFRPIGPAINEPTPPDTPPLTFVWNRGNSLAFRMEFSRNFGFDGAIWIELPDVAGDDAPAVQAYTPPPAQWCQILRLAQNPDFREIPVFWRVVATDGSSTDPADAVRTLRVLPARRPVVVSTNIEAPAMGLPVFTWETRHNERFKLRFSATDFLGDPVVDSGSGIGDGFHIPDDTATVVPCSQPAPETVSWSPSPELWSRIVQLAPGGGRVYWSVHARDALGRLTRSDVQTLTVTAKRRTPIHSERARH